MLLSLAVIYAGKAAAVEPVPQLTAEEQDKMARAVFSSISDLLAESDRETSLPKIEALYQEIIDKYPRSALSQESYWRLVMIYLHDYNPPLLSRAEELYRNFETKYPASPFIREIRNALSNSYYKYKEWSRLLRLHSPEVKKYIETGKLSNPHDMFRYSEAKYGLGDIEEAVKGYNITISLFPSSKEASLSKIKLEEIKKEKLKQK